MQKFLSYLLIIGLGAAIAGCGGQKAVEGEVDVEAVDGTGGVVSPSGLDGGGGTGGSGDSSSASGLAGGDSSSSGLDDASGGADGAGGVGADGSSGDGAGGFGDGDLLSNRVVYFEYDSKQLTAEAEQIVQAHAEYLVSAPGSQIILEGHADERGTREYNLALGEDRAKAVSDLMQAYGVSASRIQVVSYGEERPASAGYDEAAFALNRRVEILYQ